eukprot:gene8270-8458_t
MRQHTQHQPAAELITNALHKIKKLARHRKHADLVDRCQHLIDNIHEVKDLQHSSGKSLHKQADLSASAERPHDSSTGPSAVTAQPEQHTDPSQVAAAGHASPANLQELVKRTDSAISDAAAMEVLKVLQLAVDTSRPNIVEVSLDLIHKLIAFRQVAPWYLQGAAHHVLMDRHDIEHADTRHRKAEAAEGASSSAAPQLTPQALAVQLICHCDEVPDEGVEVLVLRGLLTATTSLTFTLHGQALLLAVRTCYNIHLMTRSEVNQTTAKATLTQMLNVVFQRMEAGSVKIVVKPIVVADMLANASRSSGAELSSVTTAVQGFLNNVVAAAGYGTALETPEQLKQSVAAALLALELLKVLLENSGPTFRSSERFTAAIRQYLCLSLLKNSASSIPAALQLSASIFLSLLQKFRAALKAEVGVFFPMVMLKVLEPPGAGSGTGSSTAAAAAAQTNLAVNSYSYKVVVLRCLREVCGDGQLLVDLFVNYDCDIGSSNLFERLINGLVKMAQAGLPVGADAQQLQQEQWLRQEALQCLSSAAGALWKWYRQSSGQLEAAAAAADVAGEDDASQPALHSNYASSVSLAADGSSTGGAGAAGDSLGTPHSTTPRASVASNVSGAGAPPADGSAAAGDTLSRKRAFKEKWQEGVALFNTKPKKGIVLLQNEEMLGGGPEDVAAFLANTDGLDKTLIGDYLGEREDFNLKVMHCYVDALDFSDMEFDSAIRRFLQGFRLPGEAQKIDRLMEKFAERFVKCNPASFKSADVAYVLAYSVIMLNTDAHNPQVKKKMSAEDFLKNNRGINDGQDLPAEFMRSLYDRIVTNEIKIKDELLDGSSAKAAADAAQRGNLLMNALWSIVGGYKQAESAEPSDDAIKRTLDYLHHKAQGATYFTATDPDTVRPMLELIWAPLLGCFSLLFDEYNDPRLINICLSGFEASTCLAAQLGVSNLRDVFVNSLCNFSHLHTPATMKPKNGLAFRTLLSVAMQVGNHLDGRWLEVLRCISRWELLQQMASGMPTDAVLFASGPAPGADKSMGKAAAAALKDQLRKLSSPQAGDAAGVKSIDSLAMSEASIKRAHAGAGNKEEQAEIWVAPEIISSVDTAQLNKVYVASSNLDSDAIVAFVRCLVAISLDELRDVRAPRVFSLNKIVEIAHFNMGRIRLVWSRIWAVLSQYFIAVGCHSNLAVAMYAVDSLRQLAMKFLERDELANYTFQNDFMRPFVVVMRQSQAVEIRELIIRCVSQMVLARVDNIKSGWKSMFMVFTTAAGDADPTIVRLAFDTIEKIVREHFNHITETETTTFTDCVNCLIAFTNNPHSLEVALNSIAFLRYCASKLAEGDIGELPQAVPAVGLESLGPTRMVRRKVIMIIVVRLVVNAGFGPLAEAGGSNIKFVDRDEHVYFWFPLLAGLSELTFDPRAEIRRSALEVLFDVLKAHGGSFAESFWIRIFERVLLPIFDHVRAEVTDTTTFTSERRRAQEDAWLYETCTHCLQHLVDLFGQFYGPMRPLLPRLLVLLRSFISRSHASLANVGVAAYTRMVGSCAKQLDPDTWLEVIGMLQQVVQETLPKATELVTAPQRSATSQDSPAVSAVSASTGQPRPPYTLREGVGLRRLLKFRVQASVQLLLVQAASEVYAQHYQHLTAAAMVQVADALQLVAQHARAVNTDLQLRRRLAAQQTGDRAPQRLVELSLLVLQRFSRGLDADCSRAMQLETCDTVADAAVALSALDAVIFKAELGRFFPVLTQLITCDYATADVQRALSEVFLVKVGSLLPKEGSNGCSQASREVVKA